MSALKLKLNEGKALVEAYEDKENIIWYDKVMNTTQSSSYGKKRNYIYTSLGASQNNGSVYSIYVYGDDKEVLESSIEWLYSSAGWGHHYKSDTLQGKDKDND